MQERFSMEGRMAYNDFLTEEERDELRKELEGLGRRKKVSEEDAEPEVSDSQILSDIIEETNSKLLSIEENGSYVKISKDSMVAWLYLAVPGEERGNYTMDELMGFLKKNGVVTGYHRSNLAAMIKKHVYEREIVAAQGQPV